MILYLSGNVLCTILLEVLTGWSWILFLTFLVLYLIALITYCLVTPFPFTAQANRCLGNHKRKAQLSNSWDQIRTLPLSFYNFSGKFCRRIWCQSITFQQIGLFIPIFFGYTVDHVGKKLHDVHFWEIKGWFRSKCTTELKKFVPKLILWQCLYFFSSRLHVISFDKYIFTCVNSKGLSIFVIICQQNTETWADRTRCSYCRCVSLCPTRVFDRRWG